MSKKKSSSKRKTYKGDDLTKKKLDRKRDGSKYENSKKVKKESSFFVTVGNDGYCYHS